jgi:hypothetical protein
LVAIQTPGVLCDHSSDMAHNRSVITVGPPEAVLEGGLRRRLPHAPSTPHRRAPRPPRTYPIVPVAGITPAGVVLAIGWAPRRNLLPVYLYGRNGLFRVAADILRQFEGWSPDSTTWAPDWRAVGRAGAVCRGVHFWWLQHLLRRRSKLPKRLKQIREKSGRPRSQGLSA